MKKVVEEISAFGVNVATYAIPFAEIEQVLKIISLTLSIIVSITLIVLSVVKWWKKASEDGKITKEEIQEGIDILKQGKEEIENKIKDKEE